MTRGGWGGSVTRTLAVGDFGNFGTYTPTINGPTSQSGMGSVRFTSETRPENASVQYIIKL